MLRLFFLKNPVIDKIINKAVQKTLVKIYELMIQSVLNIVNPLKIQSFLRIRFRPHLTVNRLRLQISHAPLCQSTAQTVLRFRLLFKQLCVLKIRRVYRRQLQLNRPLAQGAALQERSGCGRLVVPGR